jgi:DNA-directed RNA polymerase subunit RPC12/RpoP
MKESCTWTKWNPDDMNAWDTSCGNAHCFITDGIKENEYLYCPYCGGLIKEVTDAEKQDAT